jgi:hypothetical protein
MSTKDRRRPIPTSAPPEVSGIDTSWDDDAASGLDLDDPLNEFDRVTAIPELPAEQYAKRVMAGVQDSRLPPLPNAPPVGSEPAPEPNPFALDTAPPPPRDHSADSTAPRKALGSAAAHAAPTARPAAASRPARSNVGAPARTAPPTRPPYSPSPTGLELADLTLDNVAQPKGELPQNAASAQRDPRDPVLELELELDGLKSAEPTLLPPGADNPAIAEMKDRYAMGDFTGALVIAEDILESNPEDLDAPRYAQSCRDVLTQMYSARLGSLDQVVRVAVPSDQIRWLTLDHRAGFLLSLIDGLSTVDQILDISGMTRLDALRIVYQLLDQRVISLGG